MSSPVDPRAIGLYPPQEIQAVCVCPRCHADLDWAEGYATCSTCSMRYPVEGGIPLFLRDSDAPALSPSRNPGVIGVLPLGLRGAARWYRDRLQPDLTYKSQRSRDAATRFVAGLPSTALVVNVGSGTARLGEGVVNVDIEPYRGVDVVGVAEALPLRDACCDGLVVQAVLEHVGDAGAALREAHRLLKPHGRLFVEVPFIQGYHPAPRDFRRFTVEGVRSVMAEAGFDVIETGVAVGPGSGMAWITSEFLALLGSGRSAWIYRVLRGATRWLALPLKYTDAWLEKHPMAYVIASGIYAIGEKPAGPSRGRTVASRKATTSTTAEKRGAK